MSISSNENGFFGIPQFALHKNDSFVKFFTRLFQAGRDGVFKHVSDRSDLVEDFFVQNQCGILMQGSGRLDTILSKFKNKDGATIPDLEYEELPFDDSLVQEPMAPKVGGTGMWVTRKGSQNPSVIKFLRWLIDPQNQALWSKLSGYMPSTLAADKILEQEGFYKSNPHIHKAVLQARRPASFKTHMRIPKYDEIRGPIYIKHFDKAIEECLKTSKPIDEIARDFLYSFSEEANTIIKKALLEGKP
jgi:sn-glycerol 3-phosphate transport system substrate-binding protein